MKFIATGTATLLQLIDKYLLWRCHELVVIARFSMETNILYEYFIPHISYQNIRKASQYYADDALLSGVFVI